VFSLILTLSLFVLGQNCFITIISIVFLQDKVKVLLSHLKGLWKTMCEYEQVVSRDSDSIMVNFELFLYKYRLY